MKPENANNSNLFEYSKAGVLRYSNVYLMDCMDALKQYPDSYFDLAVVDPPYGIKRAGGATGPNWKMYDKKEWDNSTPNGLYFARLRRVSKNQIIWGGNYFVDYVPPSMGWIVWDKGQKLTMSDGELAFTSYEKALRIIQINRCYIGNEGGNIHPTQKPVKLYDWIYKNYAQPDFKILDTHLGSQSNRIAAHKAGLDFTGFENDIDYFNDGNKRFKNYASQLTLF